MSSVVYFVQQNGTNFVKIGTTTNLRARLSSINTSCPGGVVLLGFVKGNAEKEKRLHDKFKSLRIDSNREWFSPGETLLNYIERFAISEAFSTKNERNASSYEELTDEVRRLSMAVKDLRSLFSSMIGRSNEPVVKKDFLGIKEAVTMSGLSRSFIYEAIKEGMLKTVKIGTRRVIKSSDLGAWMEDHAQ